MQKMISIFLFYIGLFFWVERGVTQQVRISGSVQSDIANIGYVVDDFQVNENVGRAGHGDAVTAMANSGHFVVVWKDHRNGDADVYCQRYNSSGVPQGVNIRVNDDDSSTDQSDISIGMDGNGGFIIAWEDRRNTGSRDVYCQRFASNGIRLGGNFQANRSCTYVSNPDITVAGNGDFVIAWEDDDHIYARFFDQNGVPAGDEFVLNDSDVKDRNRPGAAIDGNGQCVVVWDDRRNGNLDIYGQRCNSNGDLLSGNFLVNDDNGTTFQMSPDIDMDEDGDFVVVWTDDRNDDRENIYGQRYNSQGSRQGSNFPVFLNTSKKQENSSVDMIHDGRFLVSWFSNLDYVYIRRFGSDGSPQTDRILVNSWNPPSGWFLAYLETNTSAGMNDNGDIVVTWSDWREGNYDIYGQRYPIGVSQSTNFRVNDDEGSSNQYYPDVVTDGTGQFIVAWQDERQGDDDIYFQRYDVGAVKIGNNVKVTNDESAKPTVSQTRAKIGLDGSGRFIIAYHWNLSLSNDARYQRFDANGLKLGNEVDLPFFYNYNDQHAPVVAVHSGGNYVLTWSELEGYGYNSDVFFQRYDNGGTPLGGAVRVNDDPGKESQGQPAIAMDGNGNFIIAWTDSRAGNSDVYFQRYNSNGSTIGSNSRINDDDESNPASSTDPAIVVDAAGNFTITWSDDRNDDWDIYARRYNTIVQPLGDDFRVNDTGNQADQTSPSVAMDGNGKVIIAWEDRRNGNFDIYGQGIDADGNLLGQNFRIDTDPGKAEQMGPSLAVYDQVLITTWYDDRVVGQRWDIYANLLDMTTLPTATVEIPTMSPDPGVYSTSQMVSIQCGTPGATIYYTTDWSDPTESSMMYTGPISVSGSTFLKARAFKDNLSPSEVVSGSYIIGGQPQSTFTRESEGVIGNDVENSNGCMWGDYNRDGYMDLYVTNWGQNNTLYQNNGNGTFSRMSSGPIVNDMDDSKSATWGDFNNDGYPDLFVSNANQNNLLFQNNQDGSFNQIMTGPVATDEGYSMGNSWGDYDNDGFLDLFVVNYYSQSQFVYHNNSGNGTFTKMLSGDVVDCGSYSISALLGDYDNDNDLDLYVTNSGQNFLHQNHGDDTFTRINDGAIVNDNKSSQGASWGDYDNDGDLDLFVANWRDDNELYRNNGDGSFTKVTQGYIVHDVGASFGSCWGDYDNDGDLDLFVANSDENNFLYENSGDGTFDKMTIGSIVNDAGYSSGCAWADYDNDGDLDLYVTNRGTQSNFFYQNGGTDNHWIKIGCTGTISNRAGIGAKVKVKANGVWQLREVSGQTGYSAQNSLIAHFGLGDATSIETLTVEWPSGIKDTFSNVAVGQYVVVTEGQPLPKASVPIYPIAATPQNAGNVFWVDIYVGTDDKPVSDLFGVSFKLRYDQKSYVHVVPPFDANVVPNGFLGGGTLFYKQVEADEGSVGIGNTRKAGQGGVDGYGCVARVKLETEATTPEGTEIQLTISDAIAIDSDGNNIHLESDRQTVTIQTGITVWPGDANNDGIVNQADVLPLGLFWNRTGPQRPDATTQWTGQPCPSWTPEAATYADANGDGTVNQADVLPLGLNWNRTRGFSTLLAKSDGVSECTGVKVPTNLSVMIDGEVVPDNEIWAVVYMEGGEDLFGIAFEMRLFSGVDWDILEIGSGAWMGEDVIIFSRIDEKTGKIYMGLSRKRDQKGVSGSGQVARIKMRISSSASMTDFSKFSVENVKAIDSLGRIIGVKVKGFLHMSEINQKEADLPITFSLQQNYPNPFNPETTITYAISPVDEMQNVRLEIWNTLGKKIRTLIDETQSAGFYTLHWDARDDRGEFVPGGMYLYRLQAGAFMEVKKMLLLR